tara:strand:- start:1940 stop:2080 length:141 start_codon:yes stop_codon:yes gene_type:complete
MDNHIEFVENIYDTVKSPFHTIMNMVPSSRSIKEKSQNNLLKNKND